MLNIGVIGIGSISVHHIESYLKNDRVKVVAFCDLNEARLQEKGKQFDVNKLYSNYEELLKDPEIDAVSICTWNNTHAEIAIAAMEAGKDVLVEKPLSMTVKEAELVQATQEKTGKLLQVGFVRRHAQNASLLKKFIDDGDLGELYYAKASILRRVGNPGGWFSDIEKSGGGPLIDIGVHMIDICWYLMGRPKPVSVTGNTYKKLGNRSNVKNYSFYQAADYDPTKNDVEDLTNAMIRFENGASLIVDVSFSLHALKEETYVKLYGDKGGAEIEPELVIVTEKNDTILNVHPQIDELGFDFEGAFQSEIDHFVDCCIDGKENIAPVSDGVEVMKMLEAIYTSAETKKEVYL